MKTVKVIQYEKPQPPPIEKPYETDTSHLNKVVKQENLGIERNGQIYNEIYYDWEDDKGRYQFSEIETIHVGPAPKASTDTQSGGRIATLSSATSGRIVELQWFTTEDGKRPKQGHYDDHGHILLSSITGLSLDPATYRNGVSDPDPDARYQYEVSLFDGNTKIISGNGNDRSIEVGEGGKATVRSGAGDDTVWVWHQKNIVYDGGAGNDTLTFDYERGFASQPSHGATIDLAAGTGTNPFGGKIAIKNVENVVGQFGAANDLRGDGHANHLQGGTLADTLLGRGGNDEIDVKYGTTLNPRATVADGGAGKDTLVAELSDSSAAPFTGSGSTLRFINTLDLEHPGNNTGTFHGGTFRNFEIIRASSSGPYYVFDFHGSEKGESVYASTSEDTIDGRGGDDIIFGGYAADHLTGGSGADHFWFQYATDSDNTNGEDTITDFKHAQHDKIDLSKIYGPKLDFIGAKHFDGHAGEVHAIQQGGKTLVEADLNGDKTADFALLLDHAPKLVEGDFLL